jgi:hypothetical protein
VDELARADKRLTLRERSQALQALELLAWDLNQAAAWLSGLGVESEADMLEQAARSVLASCWLLSRPLRTQLPPSRWSPAQQDDSGQSDGPQTAQDAPPGTYPQVSRPPHQM